MPDATNSPNPKREEVIDIASRLFYRQGYGATGIKQIIEEAKVAKGTFYTHFRSKEELGLAWLRARHHQWNQWLNDALAPLPDAKSKIITTFEFLENWLRDSNFRGCAFINTMAETPDAENPMRQQVADHKRQLHQTFQQLAAQHANPSRTEDETTRHQGTILFLLFEGALIEAQNFHEVWPIQAARKQATALLSA